MNLIQQFSAHQRRRNLAAGTITRRRYCLDDLARHVAPKSLTDVTADDIDQLLDTKNLSARTRYAWLSHLHAFYVWAIRHGHADHDPTATIDRPRLDRGLPRPIADDDLALALRSADLMMSAWVALGAYAGLRCAEIAGLTRENVLEGEGLLRVLGKGRKERMIPLHPLVLSRLRAHGLPRTGPVFVNGEGRPFSPARVSRMIAVYFDDLGIEATAHQLRHWFGSRSYRECADIRVVQELLGHSSPTTTAIYTAFSPGRASAAVASLPVVA